MIETVLHVGTEHPSLLWLFATGFLSFVAGMIVGRYSGHLDRETFSRADPEAE